MKKILLDTDIGSDIDDSLALAYLLKEPECKLVGITTVSGEAKKRASMVDAICRNVGVNDIPIYPGLEKPLFGCQRQPKAQQASRLDGWECATDFCENNAIDFMRKTIRDNPGEISLVAIGPLTNVAVLFSIDPEIPALLKELVLMCGDFIRPEANAEWNAKLDALATAIVYEAKPKIHRSIGLNVTTQVKITKDQMNELFVANVLQPVKSFAEVWFEQKEFMIYHDPLAVMTLFDDNICTFKKGSVSTVFPGAPEAGKIIFREGEGAIEVADSVDVEYALNKYFSVVNA